MSINNINRRSLLAGAAAALVATAASAQVPLVAPLRRPPPKPAPSIPAIMARAGVGGAQLGLAVLDPATGALVEGWNEGVPMPPASTLKAVTALYALERLGPEHRFATRALRMGDTLVLAGGGDPTLDTDGLARLAALTAQAAGDWRPARLAVWGGALPRLDAIEPGQPPHAAYNPSLSGIMLNFNRVHLGWRCADSCTLKLEARGQEQSPRAFGISAGVVPGSGRFHHQATDAGEQWSIPRGRLGRAGSLWLPVRGPELYAGDVFQTLCRAEGLPLPAPEVLDDFPTGTEIARIDSAPLRVVLRGMLEFSTNLTAEAVGLAASGAADLPGSAAAMARWVEATGVGHVQLADHSGLSGDSRIAPLALARLLADPARAAALRPLLNIDPLAEVLGRDAKGNGSGGSPRVAAKTGTLDFVSNLAGYADFGESVERVFAVMVADPERRAASAGVDLPAGVIAWTGKAKLAQRDLIARSGRQPRPAPPVLADSRM